MPADFGEEAKIRDYLAKILPSITDNISNLQQIKDELRVADASFQQISPDQGGPTALDLLRRILTRRNQKGLDSLHDLELIDTEFVLLDTGKPGFQPSADILAMCRENSRLYLFEVKQLTETERQAVTELSAYSHGLNTRIWNLGPADYAWIPVSTKWKTTVRAAFANEVLFAQRAVLPMRCETHKDANGDVDGIDLQLLSLVEDIDEPTALSQFAWECFDVTTFEMAQKPADFRTLVEFVSTFSARHGFSGVVVYGESIVGEHFPYPYIIVLAVHNPLLGTLKRRQLEIIRDSDDAVHGGLINMRKAVKDHVLDWHDIDFRTMQDRDADYVFESMARQAEEQGRIAEAEEYRKRGSEAYVSMKEMARASGNRTGALFADIIQRLEQFCDFEVGSPNFKRLFTTELPVLADYVSYFGLMQEAVYERLLWEASHATSLGDGPVMGGIGCDSLYAITSPYLFFAFMELMNYEHDSQTDYYVDDDDDDA